MIEQGLQDLMKSVIFMSLYESEETNGFDAPVNVEDVLMFGDEDATATGLMGQCSVQ